MTVWSRDSELLSPLNDRSFSITVSLSPLICSSAQSRTSGQKRLERPHHDTGTMLKLGEPPVKRFDQTSSRQSIIARYGELVTRLLPYQRKHTLLAFARIAVEKGGFPSFKFHWNWSDYDKFCKHHLSDMLHYCSPPVMTMLTQATRQGQ
jgi:hypothetical protein